MKPLRPWWPRWPWLLIAAFALFLLLLDWRYLVLGSPIIFMLGWITILETRRRKRRAANPDADIEIERLLDDIMRLPARDRREIEAILDRKLRKLEGRG